MGTPTKVVGLIIVLLLAVAGVWYWQTNINSAPATITTTPTLTNTTSPTFSYSTTNPLVIHHTTGNPPATKGAAMGKINTYGGIVPAFSTCDQLSVSMSPATAGSSHFTLMITDSNEGTCPAATTSTVPFTTGVALKSATASPTIDRVTINGAAVPFKLIEGK
jgi:hypothetical protein